MNEQRAKAFVVKAAKAPTPGNNRRDILAYSRSCAALSDAIRALAQRIKRSDRTDPDVRDKMAREAISLSRRVYDLKRNVDGAASSGRETPRNIYQASKSIATAYKLTRQAASRMATSGAGNLFAAAKALEQAQGYLSGM